VRKRKHALFCILILVGILTLTACGCLRSEDIPIRSEERQEEGAPQDKENPDRAEEKDNRTQSDDGMERISWDRLTCDGNMDLSYATQFQVEYYGKYKLITIAESGRFLLVPKDTPVPAGLPEDIVALHEPLEHIYLVSTSAMDFFISLDGLSGIRLSGTKESGWYLDSAKAAMQRGDILYAGKYSAPDYELILGEGCDLAIENTMIYHTPEVKEQLEELGIPVLVERSSYEPHPLGRLEWMKLYGTLLGREEQAQKAYDRQLTELESVLTKENTGHTVAFFYITGNGAVNVRKTNDYIAKMIELAGGNYVFSHLDDEEENALSTMNIQMEEFYAVCKDADYLIYNTTIDDQLGTLEDLMGKSALFEDFNAVKEGHVYCTERNFFQETTGMGQFVKELHEILSGEATQSHFLRQLR